MKKAFSFFLSMLLPILTFIPCFAVETSEYPLKRSDIHIRDPYVLVYEGKYYMYGTGLKWDGYGCVFSEDLEHWSEPQWVFQASEGFDGVGDWWAPECHYYNGSFYLFASYRSAASGKRGTAVFRSDSPLGPFVLLSDGHITPKYRDCIDGTLYVDENGQPWIIYVGEWTSNEDGIGDMYAAMLSDDLSRILDDPMLLFRGTDAKWASGRFTDGPCVYTTKTGKLLMLWSCNSDSGYAVGIARSLNNKMNGKWIHELNPLYQKDRAHPLDGGHGMIFTDLNGQLRMAIHSPNFSSEELFETAEFVPVEDLGYTLVLNDGSEWTETFLMKISRIVRSLFSRLESLFGIFKRFSSAIGGKSG